MMWRIWASIAVVSWMGACALGEEKGFEHPGMLHNRRDLDFVREKVAGKQEPWKSAWEKLLADRHADLNYSPRAIAKVIRGSYNRPDIGSTAVMNDSGAAYAHALAWAISGEKSHAAKAIEIIHAWSGTLTSIEGSDQKLLAGLTGYKFCNAAEILRYTASGWTEGDTGQLVGMLNNVYWPLIKDFRPTSNGNWDGSMIVSMLCMGVFCDDRGKFDRAVEYFLHGEGKGAITHYIYESGQCQESTRDQQHTQLGLGFLVAACEVAKKQKVDLYGAAENRLMLGLEYTAKYNLMNEVPCEGTISAQGRGLLRPIYEKAYQHYAVEKKLAMPYVRQVLGKNRPEGWHPDHESWGTLMAYRGE